MTSCSCGGAYFRAINEGNGVLALLCCRSWEKGAKPLDHFSLTIKVARGVDLSKQQAEESPAWYNPAMYNIVKQNGRDAHVWFSKGTVVSTQRAR